MSAPLRGRPLVVITEPIPEPCVAWLAERAEISHELTEANLARAEALVVRTYTHVDDALLARASRLRVVGRAGVGVDNIDVRACAARRVTVVNTPDANTGAVVEYVFALLLDALRPRVLLERALRAEEWKRVRGELVGARELADLTLGVIGLGRIGRRVAQAARGFGVGVIYTDIEEIPEGKRCGATPAALDELLREADAITIHVDNRPSNRGLIGARELALVRADVVLVNTARGFVVDADALAAFLTAHPGALALLDVHEPEPIPESHALWAVENARLAPHLGAATRTAHVRMGWVVRDVWRVLEGERPEHAVTPEG